MPSINKPRRIAHRLLLREIPRSAIPTVVAERTMVFLCVSREDKRPAPKRDMKYPEEMKRKSDPASP
jgi:hypothetical protein